MSELILFFFFLSDLSFYRRLYIQIINYFRSYSGYIVKQIGVAYGYLQFHRLMKRHFKNMDLKKGRGRRFDPPTLFGKAEFSHKAGNLDNDYVNINGNFDNCYHYKRSLQKNIT